MSKIKKPRLGRGLSSLLGATVAVQESQAPAVAVAEMDVQEPLPAADEGGIVHVAVDRIAPNPYQPRQSFDEASLDQLAASIRRDGVMQPIILRHNQHNHGYELVAGERRWRAAQRAGLETIPAIVHDLDDRQIAEWAVIENLQREDLDPIERAHAFARLIEQFGLTHEQVAERVGIDRSTVTNSLRLLHLHAEVQEFVRRGQLSAGHVRALLATDDTGLQLEIAREAIKQGWSVRKLEGVVRDLASESKAAILPQASGRSAHLTDVARQIGEQLNTKVQIKPGREKNSGKLVIDYFGLEQFDTLIRRLGVTVE